MFKLFRKKDNTSCDLLVLKNALKILAHYHGMRLDNEQFQRQYRHVFTLINHLTLKDND